MATCLAAGLLTISTASLQSVGAFSKSLSPPLSDPTRNLFRIAFYIQVFALSKWLVVTLPVDYYEFVRGLQWSVPYFNLPWEAADHTYCAMLGTNTSTSSYSFVTRINGSPVSWLQQPKEEDLKRVAAVYGSPLTAMEYSSFFENQNTIPEAEYISDAVSSNGWRDFKRSMFWLGVITGGLMLLHALLLLLLRFRESSGKERSYGALVCPRFEIFLIILGVPCICEAAVSIIKGRTHLGTAVGVLLLGLASALQLALFVFLSVGITFGKLLQYKEIHREGQQFHWYQEIIRATLGPGKRGQWEWKNQHNSVCITMFGPLFEDLRGPPKYMLTQFSGGISQKPADQIIASDDETEDAEAPFIQKLFGILRIYYTLLESIKRFSLGIVAGAFSGDRSSKAPIIALLCITFFQLFFLGLKKPFIKKRVQLVEIISISCEVGIFAACFILLEKEFSSRDERKVGISMLILFLIGYLALAINEWNALYRQIIQLDSKKNSLRVGLKTASVGFLFLFIPGG
ncbi:hypothetical protein Nepgr_018627 [Nepenthes gracilis]|uniref:Uncharacterized protein n=1 Tax=Nepenthes gracilis TaxID=150966 RepID=A0AAD3XUI0_NEPGR|nr:hypothetical protein Nepgr_018627 [Nepenthes gracilis]